MTVQKAIEGVFSTSPTDSLTCQEVCRWLMIDGYYQGHPDLKPGQVPSSVSSVVSFKLVQMVRKGLLEYDFSRSGPRGGAAYKPIQQ